MKGVLYDTELAQKISRNFPLTVSMAGFGDREYYGGLDFIPQESEGGQLNFKNGDITYCKENNTLAIFYAQTDQPDLSMEVVPIGKVTSDLKIFEQLPEAMEFTFALAE